jgi:hypothetical protein
VGGAGGSGGAWGLGVVLWRGAGAELVWLDYDELARRVLAQFVRRVAGAEPDAGGSESAVLRETVARLESELADASTRHGRLAEENARLREQLRASERSLALARESLRRLPVAADLGNAEVMLLQRLLTPADDAAGWENARA